jgi:predicted RNase H-like HicB family nuclease
MRRGASGCVVPTHREIKVGTLAGILRQAGVSIEEFISARWHGGSVLKQARLKSWIMRYAIVVERGPTSYGAYVPDLPGCVPLRKTRDEVLRLIREAIEFHIDEMREEGLEVPEPLSSAEYVEISMA